MICRLCAYCLEEQACSQNDRLAIMSWSCPQVQGTDCLLMILTISHRLVIRRQGFWPGFRWAQSQLLLLYWSMTLFRITSTVHLQQWPLLRSFRLSLLLTNVKIREADKRACSQCCDPEHSVDAKHCHSFEYYVHEVLKLMQQLTCSSFLLPQPARSSCSLHGENKGKLSQGTHAFSL